jgi:poly(3-hydroxybutyrate) depolymerase
MLYQYYEMQRLALEPIRAMASSALSVLDTPGNPFRDLPLGRLTVAALDSFEHTTRQFTKPAFGFTHTTIDGADVAVTEEVALRMPWCDLKHFARAANRPNDPILLIVAPVSGHYATLLRGTVAEFLPDHDVYVTDWQNARDMPVTGPDFDLSDYIDYIIRFVEHLGPQTHVLAVCQPAVPVLAAVALMNADPQAEPPRSMILIGGPIDTREAPTEVNNFAAKHDLNWFKERLIHRVPFGNAGFLRQVYPGFLQLTGFMSMNLGRHIDAHHQMFNHLVDGDGESLAAKRAFYDEYRAVMDLSAEYYLETVDVVFQRHLLPRGLMTTRGRKVETAAITRTAMLTIEGERDDISGIGQTRAAHAMSPHLADDKREHYEQPEVGHYGLFNGARFRAELAPRIKRFIAAQN